MAGELMLINPRRRTAKKRRASPRQLAALAKGRAARKRRHNPAPRAASRMVAASTRSRRRRNPISIGGSGLMASVMGAAQGAAGALAVDAIVTYVPLPASMTTGTMKHITKAGLAIALGILGRKFLGRAAGKMAEGALTVAAYSAGKELMAGAGMNLAYMSPAQSFVPSIPAPAMAEYVNGVGEYVQSGYY